MQIVYNANEQICWKESRRERQVKVLEAEVEGIGAHSSLLTQVHLQALLQAHL